MKAIVINNYRWFTDSVDIFEYEDSLTPIPKNLFTKQELNQFNMQVR